MKYIYECIYCKKSYKNDDVIYLCPICSKDNTADLPPKGILKVVYNYSEIKKRHSNSLLFKSLKQNGYIDLLPIESTDSLSSLKVGNTPLYHFHSKAILKTEKDFDVFLKDDALNPTFSLKDRASNLVSAFAKEKGINTIIAASTGNAGSSIAGICASQGQKAIVMVPAKAPKAKLLQILHYGAEIIPVDGTYDDAFELSLLATKKHGYYNRNTAHNPLTIEGKKTVGFEIFSDLNEHVPDYIFVSAGDGVIVSGVYKAFEELLLLGIISKMPVIVTVQSTKSSNIIDNLQSEKFIKKPATTLADSISVDVPRNFYMAKQFILKYPSEYILVTDESIINASKELSSKSGIFSEPAAATAYAGLLEFVKENKIQNGQKAVVLLTGSGLKDLKNIEHLYHMPKAVNPNTYKI